jgi:hypothetical protein
MIPARGTSSIFWPSHFDICINTRRTYPSCFVFTLVLLSAVSARFIAARSWLRTPIAPNEARDSTCLESFDKLLLDGINLTDTSVVFVGLQSPSPDLLRRPKVLEPQAT